LRVKREANIDHTNQEITVAAEATWRSTIHDAVEEFEAGRLDSGKARRTKRRSAFQSKFRCVTCGPTAVCVPH